MKKKRKSKRTLLSLLRRKKGATIVEYALLASLIGLAAVTALTLLGSKVTGLFNLIATKLTISS
jgi:pilus assembly protein Flp/PilA